MSDLNSTSFFTDENGFRFRTHIFNKTMPLGYNLKPVTTTIGVKNDTHTFTVKNDRCQAGTSPEPGHIYILINRIHLGIDEFGLPSPL